MTSYGARAGLVAGVFLAALGATPSTAQPKAPVVAAPLQRLFDCRKLTDQAARFACYDEAAARAEEAVAKGDIVVVDREQARKVRRQAFGFTLPSLSLFERGEKPEDVGAVSLKVENAARGPDGKWRLGLEGGQHWRQIDDGVLSREPRAGGLVSIRRAAMGSYLLSSGGHAEIRVHRDD